MINSSLNTKIKVASHYDELDEFYREVWGTHVHHGYWKNGRETAEVATLNLIDLMTEKVDLDSKTIVCDIGCGYGATSRYLVDRYNCPVKAFSVSINQINFARAQRPVHTNPEYFLRDWMQNDLPDRSVDFAFSIESSEHMPDFNRFFSESARILKPGGKLAIFAWLEPETTKPWMVQHLLQPICDEGRMRLAKKSEYEALLQKNGFKLISYQDISDSVSRTWTLCIRRALFKIMTERKYQKFILSKQSENREFALTLLRIRAAFALGAMKYGLMYAEKIS